MSRYSFKALALSATISLAVGVTWAQVTSPPVKPNTTVGVTPQDAKEATQKAVPKADTGTLVRTEPSATEQAKEMAKDAKSTVTPTNTNSAPPISSNSEANTSNTGDATATTTRSVNGTTNTNERPARADRN